ncbi:hypothetical protein PZE06_15840 [Robertmurraya sp. DFI.2.37]|uniref:hypothetical protein n=1 Tax=Robertmurraya sp. DFI.2.37 TaxID=3031819 RepID=UPI001CDA1648|nr:hypothetical protein [Robertmurraya sp. DFI.2.37]MDF1509613.1 hypothetical protein [Robertmurraya sp. DFI.2.37]
MQESKWQEKFEDWIRENGPSLSLFIYKQVRNKELAEDFISGSVNFGIFKSRAI